MKSSDSSQSGGASPVRTLICEDSKTCSALLQFVLEEDESIEVVGVAVNGEQAIRMTEELRPDVVTMDIQMPILDGLEATRRIMSENPTPVVIISDTTVRNDVDAAMEALGAGAVSVLEKPSIRDLRRGSADNSSVGELVDTVKAMSDVKVVRLWRSSARTLERETVGPRGEPPTSGEPRVIAIAASTGGPTALAEILGELPRDFPVPIVVVQHFTSEFLPGYVRWLDQNSDLDVRLASDREELAAGRAYVAPAGSHTGVDRGGRIRLDSTPPRDGFRPSATHLFETVAHAYGEGAVGVVLTGMGRDGLEGLETLNGSGGHVIGQNRETSAVYGMSCAAKEAGLVDVELGPGGIVRHLRSICL